MADETERALRRLRRAADAASDIGGPVQVKALDVKIALAEIDRLRAVIDERV